MIISFFGTSVSLQVEGGHFFKTSYAESNRNSHPNKEFSERLSYFCNRIVNVIEGKGDNTSLTGK